MEKSLYEVAITGSTSQLLQLLQADPDLLVRALHDCKQKNNPVHVGGWLGHDNLVKEILNRKPEFARELNAEGQTPLHLASAKGHVQVVKELLKLNSGACFVTDRDGNTPFHEAAKKGRVEVLKELHEAEPKAMWVLTNERKPIIHVCVNHNQFEAMKLLLMLEEDPEYVNTKDEDDDTILHILVRKQKYKVIKYLINNKNIKVDVNIINVEGCTALDIARNNSSGSNISLKIRGILKRARAKTARELSTTQLHTEKKKVVNENHKTWLSEMKQSLMVVAVLMATITYQAGVNPPGGVFQESGHHNVSLSGGSFKSIAHLAGTAIMADVPAYKYFTVFNTIGLFASLSLILLLVSGLTFERKISIWGLLITTWVAVASIMGSYFCSFGFVTRQLLMKSTFWITVPISIFIWLLLMFIVLGAHIFRWMRLAFYKHGISHLCRRATAWLFSKSSKQFNRWRRQDETAAEPAGFDPNP